ncbi:hypothetical protein CISIN_1g0383212mg, partial [Citrus sinensis]
KFEALRISRNEKQIECTKKKIIHRSEFRFGEHPLYFDQMQV